MKILVTGGAGHLGSHVCDLLVEQGHEVVSVDPAHSSCSVSHNGNYVSFPTTVSDRELKKWPDECLPPWQWRKYEVIYHLAAEANIRKTIEHPELARQSGTDILFPVLSRAFASEARLVFVSSAAVQFAPTIPYAIEKKACELYCQFYSEQHDVWYKRPALHTSVIRLHNVYGSPRHKPASGNLIPCLLEQKRTNGRIIVTGDGSQVRDFVHYTDAVRAIVAAADRDGITEIGSCVGRSIREVAELFDCPIDYVPRPGGEVDRQVCEQSDYPVTVNFEEAIRELSTNPQRL